MVFNPSLIGQPLPQLTEPWRPAIAVHREAKEIQGIFKKLTTIIPIFVRWLQL
jgi:hypothetical protein